jgi:hypothetical protein
MLFHCKNGCMNAPQCYVIRTLLVLLKVSLFLDTQKEIEGACVVSCSFKFQYGTCPALKGCVKLCSFVALLLWPLYDILSLADYYSTFVCMQRRPALLNRATWPVVLWVALNRRQ